MHNYVNISYGSFFRASPPPPLSLSSWGREAPLSRRARSILTIITQPRTREQIEERIGARRLFRSIRRSTDCYRLSELGILYEAPVWSQLMSGPGPGPVRTTLSRSRSVRRVINTAPLSTIAGWSITIVAGNTTKDVPPRPRAEGRVTPRAKVDSRCGRVCNPTLPVCLHRYPPRCSAVARPDGRRNVSKRIKRAKLTGCCVISILSPGESSAWLRTITCRFVQFEDTALF